MAPSLYTPLFYREHYIIYYTFWREFQYTFLFYFKSRENKRKLVLQQY